MTATNHVLTGTLIGLAIHQPVLAIVLAVLSHFVLDSLPHYGVESHTNKDFLILLASDSFCAGSVLLFLLIVRPDYWPIAFFAGIAAASPDLMWLGRWIQEMRGLPVKSKGPIRRFHSKIQRWEKGKFWPVEVVWTIGSLLVLAKLVLI